jgi:hypothetical protein
MQCLTLLHRAAQKGDLAEVGALLKKVCWRSCKTNAILLLACHLEDYYARPGATTVFQGTDFCQMSHIRGPILE